MNIDNIIRSPSKGVTATFYEYHAFVSSIEPLKVDKALQDLDWVNALHEELSNFTHNKVWSLVERSDERRHNVIGAKWVFKNKQDEWSCC